MKTNNPNKEKYKILVIRFSALGDVAMTAPVIREFLEQNLNVEITILSRSFMKPLFANIPSTCFVEADLYGKHKGIKGLFELYKELKINNFDAVADLHNVIRSQILRSFFKLFSKTKISFINKARGERKLLTRKKNKVLKPLEPMTERYADVFRDLGFKVELSHKLRPQENKINAIGIAPFAMYKGKMYPLEETKKLAKIISDKGFEVYLFGSKKEAETLDKWENKNITSVAGKYTLDEELELISKLKLMISMDSANMHLASLAGTKVISIWGATHPFAGFLGYGQKMEDAIQDETLTYRPTSIFGKDPAYAKDLDYFKNISAESIAEKVINILS